MKQQVIALVGISGVGKTTLTRQLVKTLPLQHLTAGTLIEAGRMTRSSERDQLRLASIDENQRFLIEGFNQSRDKKSRYIVIDGHVVIHGPRGLEHLDASVFSALNIDGMVHLSASPEKISSHRANDEERDRPALSELEIFEHQSRSIEVAKNICRTLKVPLFETTSADVESVETFLLNLS